MASEYPLTTELLRATGAAPRPGIESDTAAAIEARLSQALAAAQSAYEGVQLECRPWLEHVARALQPESELLSELEALHLDELWLCAACVTGSETAVAVFDRMYMPRSAAVLAKIGIEESLREELIQELRSSLFVPKPPRRPKLASYSGRGSLAAWLKVVVTRAALRRKRRAPPQRRADSLLLEQLSDGTDDAELEQIRVQYKDDFEQAVEWAFRQLRGDQRTLLRMYVTDRLTLDDLAELHRVNASTISRWLTKIREQLLEEARARLTEQLHLRPSEYDSLHRALRSRLHISVERLLAEED
ncbi:MAG TPA: sigma-70 family RNA polymerase sigma factor [Polyangiaceae bacterium]|nr:sigma-70 family RNA polymerase sigma factor [Polyangiaceae bacterium]